MVSRFKNKIRVLSFCFGGVLGSLVLLFSGHERRIRKFFFPLMVDGG